MTVDSPDPVPSRRARRNRLLWWGLRLFLVLAVSIRLYHLTSHHWLSFVHDGDAHIEYVQYIADHHCLPPVNDDFNEFPQPPTYYLLAALIYNPHLDMDRNKDHLGLLGFCISVATLCVIYLSLRHLSSWLFRYTLFIFFAFTPSFVLASACIGNDGLAVFFGALYFLFILRLNRNPGSTLYFVLAIAAILGALLSKLNGIVLLAALPWLLWRRARYDTSWKPTALRFCAVVLALGIWAGATLYRAWDETTHQFAFVHSGVWEYMEIKENLIVYTLRFDLSQLILAGQATTNEGTPDLVRFSFPSWEYGNMLLGEYPYADYPTLFFCSRQMIVAGTFLLFGLVLFFFIALLGRPVWPWRKIFSLDRVALLMIVGSTCLLLSFVYSYPDTCNADYRYQSATFSWMGYGIGRGLCSFPRSRVWRSFIWCLLGFFLYASIRFMICLFVVT